MDRQVYYYGNDQTKLSGTDVAKYAYAAGFRGTDWIKAVAIAGRESGWKPNIHGSDRPQSSYSGDRGLWQINSVNDSGLRSAGIINTPTDLFDPLVNARAAFYLYQRSGNKFAPAWSVGSSGWDGVGDPLTNTNMGAATEAVQAAVQSGVGTMPNYTPPSGGTFIPPTGSGGGESAGGLEIPFIDIPGWGTVKSAGDAVIALIVKLFDTSFWVRVLQVIGGGTLMLLGLIVMVGKEAVQVGTPAAGAMLSSGMVK